jgi:1-acyl-sn-glycerol-3-phosphate acyltransferase
MQALARRLLKLFGWSVEYADPGTRRYVLIVAPHTSNWDFPIGLLAAWALDLRAHWMGKHTLFRGPLGPLFRAWGGIPVDRGKAGNTIEQMAARFGAADHFVLGMAPEGTRGATDHWKSGFWHIARAAQVPVVMAYIDYGRKQVGMGEAFLPGDDIEADFGRLREFYADKRGKFPEQESAIRPRQA